MGSAVFVVVGGGDVGINIAQNSSHFAQGSRHSSGVSLTSASIAKKSSNPNLCVGETNTDQERRNTADVAKVNITVQSAIKLACLFSSRLLTSIVEIIDGGVFRG